MQRPTTASLANIGLFKLGPRTSQDGALDPHDTDSDQPLDRTLTRQADQKLVRELGFWDTFMHGGEKPAIRR